MNIDDEGEYDGQICHCFLMRCLQEAFIKIREQAKAYLEMKGEITSGLNLINSTNL